MTYDLFVVTTRSPSLVMPRCVYFQQEAALLVAHLSFLPRLKGQFLQ